MLKLIPRENNHGRKNQTVQTDSKPPKLMVKPEHIHLKSTYSSLLRYLKKAESTTLEDLGELIHNLQRSVITLEKKRVSLLRKNKNNSTR